MQMMKLNKNKRIGRVLFIVEGSQTEFSILKRIFCNLLGYSYIEKRRNKQKYFVSETDRFSKVAVINTRESNIRDISSNEEYLDQVCDVLREEYKFPIDQSAIYYLFDRDPKSNTDIQINKISEETVLKAAYKFLNYLESQEIDYDIDEFSEASHIIFNQQEKEYLSGKGFRVFSMLTLALLQMGILEL